MDLQLFATDEELREFPENKTDSNTAPDKTPSPKDINLTASDLPRPHTDLPKFPTSLPDSKTKCKTRRSRRYKSRSKNPIGGRSVIQVNNRLDSIREKQLVIQMTNAAYLDQLVGHSVGQPVVGPPVAAPPIVHQLGLGRPQPSVGQPSHPIPPVLSLRLQPDLNALARTLSPQTLRYVHLGIQIGRNVLN